MTLKYIWRSFQPRLSFPRPFQQSLACFRVARSPSNSWASCMFTESESSFSWNTRHRRQQKMLYSMCRFGNSESWAAQLQWFQEACWGEKWPFCLANWTLCSENLLSRCCMTSSITTINVLTFINSLSARHSSTASSSLLFSTPWFHIRAPATGTARHPSSNSREFNSGNKQMIEGGAPESFVESWCQRWTWTADAQPPVI